MYRYLTLGLLLAAIVLLGILVYKVMAGFFLPLFLAALLVVIFRPMHEWILKRLRGRRKIAAGLTTVVILVIVLAPLTLVVLFAAAEGRSVFQKFDATTLGEQLREARANLQLEIPAREEFTRIETAIDAMRQQTLPPNVEQQRDQLSYDAAELRAYAKELAIPLGLEWPDGDIPPDESADKTQRAWLDFVIPVERIGAELDEEVWTTLEDREQQQSALAAARGNFHLAIKEFFDFKTTVLGGSVRAWLTELANPDEQQARAYVTNVTGWGREQLVSLGGATTAYVMKFLLGLVIMALALFSFLLDGPAMLAALKHLTPLDDTHEDELIEEFEKVSRAVVLATLLSALAQGLLGGIGYYFAGLEPVFLLMLLTTMLALVPFIGAFAVCFPAALVLFFVEDRPGAGIFLAIYGAAIISMADNVIKPFVLHGQSNLHPLWALLSVLGGVTALGPIGILVGPMVVVFLQTLLKILQREMAAMQSPVAATQSPVAAMQSPVAATPELTGSTPPSPAPRPGKKQKRSGWKT